MTVTAHVDLLVTVGEHSAPEYVEGSALSRRQIEDDAVSVVGQPFGAQVADLLWQMANDVRVRDPWLMRVLGMACEQRQAALRAVGEAVEYYRADGELLSVAALLSWAIGQDVDNATAYATAAIMAGTRTGLAALILDAVELGMPPRDVGDGVRRPAVGRHAPHRLTRFVGGAGAATPGPTHEGHPPTPTPCGLAGGWFPGLVSGSVRIMGQDHVGAGGDLPAQIPKAEGR